MDAVTELPLDVLRSIWYYLNLPDVIRFGRTAKNMLNLTWSYYQEVSMARDWPVKALSFVLARDLSHVRSLELLHQSRTVSDMPDSDSISLLIQQLESLKFSKLSNLHTLTVDVEFPTSATAVRNQLDCIKDIISKNNQLHMLSWYTAEVEENFNVGQFLVEHSRLTQLNIQAEKKLIGFSLLTQLKSLGLSFCKTLDDDIFLDVMTLTQLRSFDIAYNDTITDRSFTKITNLANLEELEMRLNNGINSTSLKLLHNLPNLRDLCLNCPWKCDENQFEVATTIIGQLSQLTSLRINNYDGYLDFNLTALTNLKSLDIDTRVDSADFSNFTKLTNLAIRCDSFKISTLPPNVEDLNISANKSEEIIKTICGLSKLRHLHLNARDFNGATIMAQWITQLTQLFELVVIPTLPKELIPALQKLPNLASLMFSEPPKDNKAIEEMAKLTQVMELTYWSGYNADLKTKLPFSVCYIGDFDDGDTDYIEDDQDDSYEE